MVRPVTRTAALGLVALLSAAAMAQDDAGNIALGVGSQRVITVPGVIRLAIGDPSVAEVKSLPSNQILITGQSEGRTTLLIWKANGSRLSFYISVRKKDPNEIVEEIKRLLGDREGITVRQVGDRIYLDGYAYTNDDHERVEQIVGLYPQVKSFVKVNPNAKKLVANSLNAALQRAGLKNVQANVVGTTIFLEGSVESPQDLQKAEMITKAIGEKVENLLVVGIKRMILSEVQFLEIRRKNEDKIGIKLPLDFDQGKIDGTFSIDRVFSNPPVTTKTAGLSGGASSQFALQLIFNDGYGRLLAQPKLVCASGEKAEFFAGGELPIPLITANSMTVEYKPFGVKLSLKPTADRQGNIQTEIEAEVSGVDRSIAASFGANINIPGFRTRRVKTNVTVRHGETIVMGGIFEHDEDKNVSKFPLLGHIPLIGEFFKNRVLAGTKRELLIVVTPRIVTPDTERIRQQIDDMKQRYKQARDEVTFSIFD